MKFETFDELEVFLANWLNFHESGPYDFNGALNLLAALLRSMKKNALESDFDELETFFDQDELYILQLMLDKLKQSGALQ